MSMSNGVSVKTSEATWLEKTVAGTQIGANIVNQLSFKYLMLMLRDLEMRINHLN